MAEGSFWNDPAWRRRVRSTSLGVWGSTLLAFAGTVVAARALGPSEYGAAVLALATTGLVATVLDVTFEQGMVHHGFRALARDDVPGLKAIIRNGMLLDLAVGLVITGGIILLAGPIASGITGDELTATIIQIAALKELGGTLDPSTAAMLQLGERQDLRAWSMTAGSVARLGAVVLAVSLGADAEGIVAAFASAAAVSGALQAFLAWRVVRNRWPEPARRGRLRANARTLVPFAFHSSVTTTLLTASNSLVPVLLGRLAGTSAVGLFRVARLPINFASIAAAPFQLMMYPEMTKRATDGRAEELRDLIHAWMRIGFLLAVPAVVVAYVLMPWALPAIYGPRFDGAITAAQIMLIPAFVGFAFAWMKNFLASIGRPQTGAKIAFAPLFLAVPLTALLAESHGAEAAAVGVAASAVAMCASQLVVGHRYFRERVDGRRPRTKRAVIAAVAGSLPPALRRPILAATAWRLRASGLRAGAAICWHRVGDPPGDPERELVPALGTAVFEDQLRHLGRAYRVVPASELREAARGRRRWQRFPVALTFDDDLASHADVAAPILRRERLPATFFLTGATLQEPATFWWERLQVAVDQRLDIEGGIVTEDIHRTAQRLIDSPPPERDELLRTLEQIPAQGEAGLPAEAVRSLNRDGLEVGFHTLRHATLTQLADEELATALHEGRDCLADVAGAPLSSIAYPHGRADARVATAARDAGYQLGFTTRSQAVTEDGDPMLLGRLQAPFSSADALELELLRTLARARRGSRSWRLRKRMG